MGKSVNPCGAPIQVAVDPLKSDQRNAAPSAAGAWLAVEATERFSF